MPTSQLTHRPGHRLRDAVGVDLRFRFGGDAGDRQARRDSVLTEINQTARSTAITTAVYDATKRLHEAGGGSGHASSVAILKSK